VEILCTSILGTVISAEKGLINFTSPAISKIVNSENEKRGLINLERYTICKIGAQKEIFIEKYTLNMF